MSCERCWLEPCGCERYVPAGDGTYKSVPPCRRCGCTSFLLHDNREPECLRCFSRSEKAQVRRERLLLGLVDE